MPAFKIDGFYPSIPYIEYAMSVETFVSLDITGAYDSGTRTGTYTVSASASQELPVGNYVLYVTLTEDPTTDVYGTWYDTMRQAYPDYAGTPVTFSGGFPQTVEVSGGFGLDYANEAGPYAGVMVNYLEENCRLVAWLQDTAGQKKVQQSANVYVGDLGDLTNVPDAAPARMALGRNFPNPFNPSTVIPVKVDENSSALLEVVGVDGRRVALLHNGLLTEGDHEFRWDGRNVDGQGVASGVYMARLITKAGMQSERLVLLK